MALCSNKAAVLAIAEERARNGWPAESAGGWQGGPLFLWVRRGGLYKPRTGNSHQKKARYRGPRRKR